MGLDIDDDGIDSNLRRLSRGNNRLRGRALLKASEIIEARLKANTPVGPGDGPHAKNYVVVSRAEIDREGDLNVRIGYSKEVAWRVKFVELGTVHMPPQGFIKQTAEQNNQVVLQIIARELRRELGL